MSSVQMPKSMSKLKSSPVYKKEAAKSFKGVKFTASRVGGDVDCCYDNS